MSKKREYMSDAKIERLVICAEEGSEVTKACTKAIRHGYDGTKPGFEMTNREALERELGDIKAVSRLMIEQGDLSDDSINHYADEKYEALKSGNWTRYQKA